MADKLQVYNNEQLNFDENKEEDQVFELYPTLSYHILAPLFLEYDTQIQTLERELKRAHLDMQKQAEDAKVLVV